ncbi:uncharacterized protein LOC117295947 [Asterias rubens]|uniref:uncharacterized protein LOC117295947 n=1 Tax=Asterias rubens TaxID=7604 RepID=UPI00145510E9|nr:uncharacterized protein LOC117295947 [Asterias rubens]
MCSKGRNITGVTFFFVVFLAVIGLLHSAPARRSFEGQTIGRDKVNMKRRSSPSNSTLPPYNNFSPTYCNFSVFKSESFHPVKEFNRLVKKGAIFVYLKLDFVNVKFDDPSSTYLEDIGNIIDPLTWVWSKGGRGKLLLGAPFNFNMISLTTLSHGVFSLTVKINASSVCNEPNSTDEDTLKEIKGLLQDMTKGENDARQAEVYDDDGEIICLEKQMYQTNDRLFASPFKLMEETSAYDCWQRGGDQVRVVRTEFWLTWIRVIGIILALFAPMAVRFLQQKNPPESDENGVDRLSLESDLPIGLKYTLFNWGNSNILVFTLRYFVFVGLFIVMEYVPQCLLTNTESYSMRNNALHRCKLIDTFTETWYNVGINLFTIIFHLIILFTCVKGTVHTTRTGTHNRLETHEESQSFEHRFQNFFEQDMLGYRAKMILNVKCWSKLVLYSWPLVIINRCIHSHIDSDVCLGLLSVLLYLPCVLLSLVYFAAETLPLLFFLKFFIQLFLPRGVKKISVLGFVLPYLLGIYTWTYKLVMNLFYVAEVLVHTFMGTVINADKVGPYVMTMLVLAMYVVDAVTSFYDGYHILLSDVMKEADALMDEAEVRSARRMINNQTSLGDGGNKYMGVIEEKEIATPLVKYKKNGIPTIELQLFWLIVEKYRPVRVHVARIMLQVIGITLLAVFWVNLLGETDSVHNNISTTVKIFSTVLLAGLFPLVNHLLNSTASQEFSAEARKTKIRMDILNIVINGKLSTTTPKEILRLPKCIRPEL